MSADRKELCEDLSMYVLGGLDKKEREAFEEHLKLCPKCQQEAADMTELVNYFPLTTEEVEPPKGMKSRILTHVLQSSIEPKQDGNETKVSDRTVNHEPERSISQRKGRIYTILSVASIVLLITTSVLAVRLNVLNEDKSNLLAEVEKLRGQLALSNEPATGLQVHNVVSLKPTVKDLVAQGTAMIVIDSKGTHLIVQAEKLPELKGDEAFQVWLLKGGKPVNAGTFLTQDGTGALYYTFSPDDYDTIAITQEPDANGKEPRGNIVLAAEI